MVQLVYGPVDWQMKQSNLEGGGQKSLEQTDPNLQIYSEGNQFKQR